MSDEIYEKSFLKPLLWLFLTVLNGGRIYSFFASVAVFGWLDANNTMYIQALTFTFAPCIHVPLIKNYC